MNTRECYDCLGQHQPAPIEDDPLLSPGGLTPGSADAGRINTRESYDCLRQRQPAPIEDHPLLSSGGLTPGSTHTGRINTRESCDCLGQHQPAPIEDDPPEATFSNDSEHYILRTEGEDLSILSTAG